MISFHLELDSMCAERNETAADDRIKINAINTRSESRKISHRQTTKVSSSSSSLLVNENL